jgi:hypothetical protein
MVDRDEPVPGMAASTVAANTAKVMWDRRMQGDLVADIGHELGFTPLQVLDVLRAERLRREAANEPVRDPVRAAGADPDRGAGLAGARD